MRAFSLLILLPVFVLISCKDKKNNEQKPAETTPTAQDTMQIKQTILDFYSWYNLNYERMQAFELAKGTNTKDQPPYKLDWNEVDKLHQYIRNSVPQLGNEFIKNQRSFFQQAESEFAKHPDEEIPYGFDYDWYTNSQEDPQYLLDEIKRANNWLITIKDSVATADIRGAMTDANMQVENSVIIIGLKKEDGKWKISKIGEN